jgi:hypothetical protein
MKHWTCTWGMDCAHIIGAQWIQQPHPHPTALWVSPNLMEALVRADGTIAWYTITSCVFDSLKLYLCPTPPHLHHSAPPSVTKPRPPSTSLGWVYSAKYIQ